MKKKYLIGYLIIVTAIALLWFSDDIVKAAGGAFGLNTTSNPSAENGQVTATSTLNYLTPGTGTTTVTTNTRGTDQVDFNVFLVASTTATTDLRWTVEFSHSTTSVAANQIWFPLTEDINTNATTTFRTQLAKEYAWVPALDARHNIATSTAADGTFTSLTAATRISIKDIAAEWTRVIFYMPTAGATLTQSTALDKIPLATSTNAGIQVFAIRKDPL